jgi:hypothetical protein
MNSLEALKKAISLIEDEYFGNKSEESPSKELIAQIKHVFQSTFDNPPLSEFEFFLRKTFTLEEIRITLFSPSDEQVVYYSCLLTGIRQNVSAKNFGKLKNTILSFIFLLHRKHWSFLSEFLITGGIDEVVYLFDDSNLYIRTQALEIFLSVTQCG